MVLGAALLRDALAEALAQSQTLTTAALGEVVERLKVLSKQVIASSSGGAGGGSSSVRITNTSAEPVPVDGTVAVSNFPASQPVSGTVNVGNFPATQNVAVTSSVEVEVKNDSGSPIPVSGTVTITDGSGPVTVDGTVAVSNFPATQPVSGTVAVSNFPASVEISNDTGNAVPVNQLQILDTANSTTRTVAHGATQYVGGWSLTRSLGVQRCLTVLASNVSTGLGGTFIFEFSENGSTATISETRTITSFSSVRDFDLENFGTHYRVKFTPSRALVGSEEVYITTQFATQDPGRFVRLANQQVEIANTALPQNLTFLQGFDQSGLSQNFRALLASNTISAADYALFVKSQPVGLQPDGDYVNAKADGTVSTTTTPLGASGVYTSAWFDTDGWRGIEVVVVTNVVSATNGLTVQFTDDVQGTQTVRSSRVYTFTATDVTNGFLTVRFPVELDGFRIVYTNGGSAQGSFFLSATVRTELTELARSGIETQLTSSSSSIMSRDILAAKNAAGTYGNIERGTLGGLDIGIVQQEVELQAKSCSTHRCDVTTVSSGAAQRLDVTQLSDRKYITLSNNDATKSLWYGTTSALLAGSQAILLPAGASHQQEWDTNLQVWATASSATVQASLSQSGGVV